MRISRLLMLAGVVGYASSGAAIETSNWTCIGTCGTSGADGVVSLSPVAGSTSFGYVTTQNGVDGLGLPGIGGDGSSDSGRATNGSRIRSAPFSGTAGQQLSFHFNYITSDGAGYSDYAWARLLDANGDPVALLFTARTTIDGNTVPGFSMPQPAATLIPPATPIKAGGPEWSPLGMFSGLCFDVGCGYTGWTQAIYALPKSGSFVLELGAVNWDDTFFDSGIAFDGATIGGQTPAPILNYQGLWWNPQESGWGINFAHQGDIIFATWFTYDADHKPWWLIAQLEKTASGVYSGGVSTVAGPPLGSVPFPPGGSPGGAVETPVGTMTATFTDARHGTIAYTVNGTAQTKAIIPQVFGPLLTCAWGVQPNMALATNYTDLWWNALESGWGINFSHQGDIVFATWFTYDAARQPRWLIAQLEKTAGGVYTGPVSTVTGPPFNAVPFPPGGSPGGAIESPAGTATATFVNGNSATLAYAVNGVSQTKQITRQVFAPPGTVCY